MAGTGQGKPRGRGRGYRGRVQGSNYREDPGRRPAFPQGDYLNKDGYEMNNGYSRANVGGNHVKNQGLNQIEDFGRNHHGKNKGSRGGNHVRVGYEGNKGNQHGYLGNDKEDPGRSHYERYNGCQNVNGGRNQFDKFSVEQSRDQGRNHYVKYNGNPNEDQRKNQYERQNGDQYERIRGGQGARPRSQEMLDKGQKPSRSNGGRGGQGSMPNHFPPSPPARVEHTTSWQPVPPKHPPKPPQPLDKALVPMTRPGFGTKGAKIQMVANYFPIEFPHGVLYRYDIEVISERDAAKAATDKMMGVMRNGKSKKQDKGVSNVENVEPSTTKFRKANREVFCQMLKQYEKMFKGCIPVYDGMKTLLTRNELGISSGGCKLSVKVAPGTGKGEKRYQVTIKKTDPEIIDLEPLHDLFRGVKCQKLPHQAIMAMDIILNHGPSLKLIPLRQTFFSRPTCPQDVHPLGGGRQVWFGYYQSFRPAQWKPILNIDKAVRVFYSAKFGKDGSPVPLPLVDFVKEICGKNEMLGRKDIDKLSMELKGLRIQTTHQPSYKRKFTVKGISNKTPRQLTFHKDVNGKSVPVTVEHYFADTYNKILEFSSLPCLEVGSNERTIHFPMEVCELVPNQRCLKKLTADQTASMIKKTAMPPELLFRNINKTLQDTLAISKPYLDEFGITIQKEPLKVEGRVLEAPSVWYESKNGITATKPKDGVWDLKDRYFVGGANVNRWIVLHSKVFKQEKVKTFIDDLINMGRNTTLNLTAPLYIGGINLDSVPQSLCDIYAQFSPLDLVFIVIPGDAAHYNNIKKVSETELGVITQCIKEKTILQKSSPSLLANVCQKINAKMGGINSSLVPRILEKPIMIIGADVTHPGPTEDRPSVAAAVGSLDGHPSRYHVTLRIQEKGTETIVDLKGMVMELLKAFRRNMPTHHVPERIIMYRDGVSEGQFEMCLQKELASIREACLALNNDYRPEITFIVVQKRHHSKFKPFAIDRRCSKNGNIPPGTTMDQTVSHPTFFDFFLCSHYGLQGTSKPAHYTILYDDGGFTADQLQELTYQLCHTFVRCTRSLSLPAPVQYAHLAAFRARTHISSLFGDNGSQHGDKLDLHKFIKAVTVCPDVEGSMYYV